MQTIKTIKRSSGERRKPAKLAGAKKTLTGIEGFDEITHGGLPPGRATLLLGGPGSGKTVMALQTLVNGARRWKEPGIFVAFEENSRRIIANADSFGWDLATLEERDLLFVDAQPSADLIYAGGFDLEGMLAVLEVQVQRMGAKRIVFDSIDIMLALLDDARSERRELYRLHEWLLRHDLTAIITGKADEGDAAGSPQQPMSFVRFMVDCAVALNQRMIEDVSQRSLRVLKYRGSSFAENECPLVIGSNGMEVGSIAANKSASVEASAERISTGVERLDSMLTGGYHRGASILFTGSPGTSKTTLCGSFAQAACERGERTLFVSFDSEPGEIIRNLASVGLDLKRFEKKKLLQVVSARSISCSAEIHLMQIKRMAREFACRCLIIDPVSALSKAGNEATAHSVIERLIDWAKAEGITIVCTSLVYSSSPELEGTSMQISTIADTWIHLSYLVHAGERNRAITIIKSRGTAHSNQVRELILHDSGITLADVYTERGEVLMGTLRWQQEEADRAERAQADSEIETKRLELKRAERELEERLVTLQGDLDAKRVERKRLTERVGSRDKGILGERTHTAHLRRADEDEDKDSGGGKGKPK